MSQKANTKIPVNMRFCQGFTDFECMILTRLIDSECWSVVGEYHQVVDTRVERVRKKRNVFERAANAFTAASAESTHHVVGPKSRGMPRQLIQSGIEIASEKMKSMEEVAQ